MDLSEAIEYLTPIAESAQVGHYGEALSTVLKAIQDTSQYYGLCTKAGHENCELFPFNAEWGIIHHPKKETPVNIKEEIVRTLSEQETLHDLATALIPLIRRAQGEPTATRVTVDEPQNQLTIHSAHGGYTYNLRPGDISALRTHFRSKPQDEEED